MTADALPEPTYWTSDPCPVWSIEPHGSARVCRRCDGVVQLVAGTVRGVEGARALNRAVAAAVGDADLVDLDVL